LKGDKMQIPEAHAVTRDSAVREAKEICKNWQGEWPQDEWLCVCTDTDAPWDLNLHAGELGEHLATIYPVVASGDYTKEGHPIRVTDTSYYETFNFPPKRQKVQFGKMPYGFGNREATVMLRTLAIHFSEKTQTMVVPKGTTAWKVTKFQSNGYPFAEEDLKVRDIIIPIMPFFGMMVGYNSELDVLVYWIP
jgi:hypothetical protein